MCTTAGASTSVADLEILRLLPASESLQRVIPLSKGGDRSQQYRQCSTVPEKSPALGSKYPIWDIGGEDKLIGRPADAHDDAWLARVKVPPPIENIRLLEKWKMNKNQISKVVKGSDAVHNLAAPVIEKKLMWLSTEWDFKESEVADIVQTFPPFLSTSVETNAAPGLDFFIRNGYSKADVRKMVRSAPWLLAVSPKLRTTIDFFKEILGFTEKDIVRVLVKNPHILRFTIEENLRPKVDFFLGLGLKKIEVMNLVKDCPKVMRSSLPNCMQVNLEKLQGLGLKQTDIAVIVRRCPQLITRDFDRIFLPKFEWLRGTLGLKDEKVTDYFKTKPTDFIANLETWKQAYLWFCGILGDSDGQAAEFLQKNPTFISYKVDGLQEKLDFAMNNLQKSLEDVFACPTYLLVSFESRILLRAAYLDSKAEILSDVSLIELFNDRRKFCQKYDVEEYNEAQRLWQKMSKDEKLESIKTHKYPWVKAEPKEVPYF